MTLTYAAELARSHDEIVEQTRRLCHGEVLPLTINDMRDSELKAIQEDASYRNLTRCLAATVRQLREDLYNLEAANK